MSRTLGLLITTVLMLAVLTTSSSAVIRMVLAQEFTGTTCYYCPGAMMGLHNLQEEVGWDRVAVIAYHTYGNDDFEIPGCDEIFYGYYGGGGVPQVWFDGVIQRIGGHHTEPVNYYPQWAQREGIPSPLIIDLLLVSYDGSTGQGTVQASMYNETDTTVDGQLRLVATGDDTLYNWQGFDHLYFTALDIFPDVEGVAVSIQPGQTVVENQDFVIPEGWRDRDCTIVGYVQNDETMEVQQVAKLGQVTPVELVSFTGRMTKDGVLLTWMTATEQENAGFMIYRVANGQTELLTPDMIPGAGTTAIPQRYEFIDGTVEPGTTYLYKLSDVSLAGIERFNAPVAVTVPSTWGTPSVLHLEPVRPCPAENEALLSLSLPEGVEARVSIYDVAGRKVRMLPSLNEPAGTYTMVWDLTDDSGAQVSPGLYFVRAQGGGTDLTRRIVVAR
jgi:hypothetical protein